MKKYIITLTEEEKNFSSKGERKVRKIINALILSHVMKKHF
jgi:hypothetical protein